MKLKKKEGKKFAFKGMLDVINIVDVFNLLQMGRKTGCLIIIRDAETKFIYFRQGDLEYAESNRDDEKVFLKLESYFGIEISKLQELYQKSLEEKKPFLNILVEEGIIEESEQEEYNKRIISEELYDLFFWNQGEFEFIENKDLPATAMPTEMPVTHLILEGMQLVDELLRDAPALKRGDIALKLSRKLPNEFEEITFDRNQWSILSMLDGSKTINELQSELADIGDREFYHILKDFIEKGLAVPVEMGEEESFEGSAEESEEGSPDELGRKTLIFNLKESSRLDEVETSKDDLQVIQLNYKLIQMEENEILRTFPIPAESLILGRGENADVRLENDPTISRVHARIIADGDGYAVEDLNSINGIFVNEEKTKFQKLKDGDVIRIGRYSFIFQSAYLPANKSYSKESEDEEED